MVTMNRLVDVINLIPKDITILKLVLSALLCGIVGLEREIRKKPAGLRTNILIGLGATVFTIISYQMAQFFGGDPTRIASQIITGIGFIGAGVIVQSKASIKGITTAATIFVVASIGMAIGAGKIFVAVVVTVISVAVLYILGYFENRIEKLKIDKEIIIDLKEKNSLNKFFEYTNLLDIDIKSIKYESLDKNLIKVKLSFSADNELEKDKCDLLCGLLNGGDKYGKK